MERGPKIYVYKMTTDNGGAPCVWRGRLSLAICKPKIRSTAEEGSIIFGFGGKAYDERLIYIAKVTEKPPRGDYYRNERYAGRPDCIYRENTAGGASLKKGAKYHSKGDQLEHDIGQNFERADVLLSDDFRYFGSAGDADYKKHSSIKAVIEKLTQGHRVPDAEKLYGELMLLRDEMWGKFDKKKVGEPISASSSKVCGGKIIACICKPPPKHD
jgi:hypothetical protein